MVSKERVAICPELRPDCLGIKPAGGKHGSLHLNILGEYTARGLRLSVTASHELSGRAWIPGSRPLLSGSCRWLPLTLTLSP
ncbi:hypothetical protein ELI43_04160 [Rhizobium leguminosarum]|nr:hypothetical protein ELI43_04160 [Rhizobium leguminosarum]